MSGTAEPRTTEAPGDPRSADPTEALEFLVRFTEVGHAAGYPAADLEERLTALAGRMGIDTAQASVTPTVVELSVGSLAAQRTFTLRVRPRAVDLDAVARLDDLVHDVLDGGIGPGEGLSRLADIQSHPLVRPWFVRLGAYALAGAAVAPVLGGSWRDVAAGAVVGLVVGAIALAARRVAKSEPMVAPIAAVAASFSAGVLVDLGLKASPDVVTLAALVTLLPGMALTIGVRELATQHLQSGVANTASALVQLLGLVFGVGGLVAGVLHRSPLVFIVPGVLILVPGSAGFRSLLQLLTGQTVSGIDAGFDTFVTAISIAYGLMLSTVLLPRRFTEVGERRADPA